MGNRYENYQVTPQWWYLEEWFLSVGCTLKSRAGDLKKETPGLHPIHRGCDLFGLSRAMV